MATPARARKASDSLKGAAVPVEEPAAPAGDVTAAQSLFGIVPATAGETSEVTPAPAEAPATVEPVTPDEAPEDDVTEFDVVTAVVAIDQFSYFDDDGAHMTATKGDVVTLDADVASRGFQYGALRPQD